MSLELNGRGDWFEPATSRTPSECVNQAALRPDAITK